MSAHPTLHDAIVYFADYENCHQFVVHLRWLGGRVKCPVCGAKKLTYLAKNRVWKCYADHQKPRFSLKTGTIFEDSPIGLGKWLPAVWLLLNARNDISSWELHRALGVTQKTAWFMLHRIRLAMRSKAFTTPGGVPRQLATEPFENTPEFRRFREGLKRLLAVPKEDLDRRVREAKLNSERLDNPAAPGRRRKTSGECR